MVGKEHSLSAKTTFALVLQDLEDSVIMKAMDFMKTGFPENETARIPMYDGCVTLKPPGVRDSEMTDALESMAAFVKEELSVGSFTGPDVRFEIKSHVPQLREPSHEQLIDNINMTSGEIKPLTGPAIIDATEDGTDETVNGVRVTQDIIRLGTDGYMPDSVVDDMEPHTALVAKGNMGIGKTWQINASSSSGFADVSTQSISESSDPAVSGLMMNLTCRGISMRTAILS